LMRSDEPSLAGPGPMLDAATQLGRLPALGRRTRTLAARAIAESSMPSLFMNLHPVDLLDVDLVDEKSPLTRIASRVVLEVTERESLVTSTALTERLDRLRELGFRLAVDDIGAGYSGLTSFTDLMPEIVKIDMSLVRSIHTSVVKQRTVGALCSLCHEIGTVVVGEGVETHDEQNCLIDLGCDLLQGYLIARPNRELPQA
jgi:EAL domain-containing protein (putative c-di-GMP-specific phosphodiesterase class I)